MAVLRALAIIPYTSDPLEAIKAVCMVLNGKMSYSSAFHRGIMTKTKAFIQVCCQLGFPIVFQMRLPSLNVPALQLVACVEPAKQEVPAAQAVHWLLSLKPISLECVPAGHGSTAVEPAGPACGRQAWWATIAQKL